MHSDRWKFEKFSHFWLILKQAFRSFYSLKIIFHQKKILLFIYRGQELLPLQVAQVDEKYAIFAWKFYISFRLRHINMQKSCCLILPRASSSFTRSLSGLKWKLKNLSTIHSTKIYFFVQILIFLKLTFNFNTTPQ